MNTINALVEEGHPIIATPHLGNYTRHHMAYPQMKVKLRSLESNQSCKDSIFTPELLKVNQHVHSLIDSPFPQLLSPYLSFTKKKFSTDIANLVETATSPAALHYASLSNVIGKEYNLLTADYFLDEYIFKIFEVLLKNGVDVFDRQVSNGGLLEKRTMSGTPEHLIAGYAALMNQHIKTVLGEKVKLTGGPILSNIICVLCDIIQYSRKKYSQNNDVYTVSGKSMIHYTKSASYLSELNHCYSILKNSHLFPELPDTLQVHMIPGSYLSFLPTEQETEMIHLIQEIISVYKNQQLNQHTLSQFHALHHKSHFELLSTEKSYEVLHLKRGDLSKELKHLKLEFKKQKEKQHFFSQYDALQNNTHIAKIPALMDLSFKEIDFLFSFS